MTRKSPSNGDFFYVKIFPSLKEKGEILMIKKFFLQFSKPEGLLGSFVGKLMAATGKEKNRWTISNLEIKEDDYILEIGFGPGVAVEMAAKIATKGKIVGVDYSSVMLKQATKRNKNAIIDKQVQLLQADANNLPTFDMKFDKVYSINSIIFWKDPIKTLKHVKSCMKDGGIIAITIHPYQKGDTEKVVKNFGANIRHYLSEAGFTDIQVEYKPIKPSHAVCVIAKNKH